MKGELSLFTSWGKGAERSLHQALVCSGLFSDLVIRDASRLPSLYDNDLPERVDES